MASPDDNTFSLTPPRRPGVDDFNGADKEDDAEDPPDPETMPNAAEMNTVEKTLVGMGKVVPVAVISVRYTAGVPAVYLATYATDESFVLTVTDTGTGDCSLTWPAGTFPAAIAAPTVCINGATAGMINVEEITNGVRVYGWSTAGAPADRNFTVTIY